MNSFNLCLGQLTNTIEKRSGCQLVLTIKPASAIRGGIIQINGPSTCCAEAEADTQSSNPMDPDIYCRVQLGLTL